MAFLASGSDPTVIHCCKIANGKEQGVSRFLHRSPTWFLVLSHTGGVYHIYVYNVWISVLTSVGYFIGSRATGSTVQPFRPGASPGAVGKGAV